MSDNGEQQASQGEGFQEDPPRLEPVADSLVLNLDGFEGPIDLLLTLARDQKVDLAKISILALAEQYLSFIQRARELRLEIAADYLVMAAWLAFLKSKLLIPKQKDDEDGEDAAEMAARLAFQLQRLDAMRNISKVLLDRPRLGQDFFPRGMPEPIRVERQTRYEITLFELLTAYGQIRDRTSHGGELRIMPTQLYSMEQAVRRLRFLIGDVPEWTVLENFLPDSLTDPLVRRSAVASTFAASLELTREGLAEIRQAGVFEPIYVRKATAERAALAADDDLGDNALQEALDEVDDDGNLDDEINDKINEDANEDINDEIEQ